MAQNPCLKLYEIMKKRQVQNCARSIFGWWRTLFVPGWNRRATDFTFLKP